MERAAEQTLRAGQIIRRLREFVARGEVERRPENLARLVEEASALALVGLKETALHTRFVFGSVPVQVMVDRVQIQQVILNLIRNAAEAMQDSPQQQLTIAMAPSGRDMVDLTVADTGSGISEEVAARLFQPFTTTKAHGMGVGLSISRTIIEAHGGQLHGEPNPGGGAIFRITLPVLETEAQRDAP